MSGTGPQRTSDRLKQKAEAPALNPPAAQSILHKRRKAQAKKPNKIVSLVNPKKAGQSTSQPASRPVAIATPVNPQTIHPTTAAQPPYQIPNCGYSAYPAQQYYTYAPTWFNPCPPASSSHNPQPYLANTIQPPLATAAYSLTTTHSSQQTTLAPATSMMSISGSAPITHVTVPAVPTVFIAPAAPLAPTTLAAPAIPTVPATSSTAASTAVNSISPITHKANKPKALLKEERKRRGERTHEIAMFTHKLRKGLPPFIQGVDPLDLGPYGRWKSARTLKFTTPFPDFFDFTIWPVFVEMENRDVSGEVIKNELNTRTPEITGIWQEWKAGLEAELVKILEGGRVSLEDESLAQVQKFGDVALPNVTLTATIVDPPISSSKPPYQEVLSKYSPHVQLLLRADSIFRTNYESGPYFYPVHFELFQRDWYYYGPWEPDAKAIEQREFAKEHDQRMCEIEYDVRGVKIARRFLKELGCPDASYIELASMGPRFLCGRCDEFIWPVDWAPLVTHYLEQEDEWNKALETHSQVTSHPTIKYKNLHDFSVYDKPTIVLVDRTEQRKLFKKDEHHVGFLMRCKLCKELGLRHTGWGKSNLEFHVKNVHMIDHPQDGEHFSQYSG